MVSGRVTNGDSERITDFILRGQGAVNGVRVEWHLLKVPSLACGGRPGWGRAILPHSLPLPRIDLDAGDFGFGLAQLGEVAQADIAREEANDHEDHQEHEK